jgi:hypothetical protein
MFIVIQRRFKHTHIYIVVCECVNAQYATRMQCFEIPLYVILPFVCFGLPYMWSRLISALQASLLTKVKFMKFLRLCLQTRWNNDDVINFCVHHPLLKWKYLRCINSFILFILPVSCNHTRMLFLQVWSEYSLTCWRHFCCSCAFGMQDQQRDWSGRTSLTI